MTYFPVQVAPEMNHATLAALAASATLAAGACKSDRSRCEELAGGRDYAATYETCARAFEQTGDDTLGAHAAVGAFYSMQGDVGHQLLKKLGDAPQAGKAWRAAGDWRYQQGSRDTARSAYQRALTLHDAAGDDGGRARVLLSLSTLALLDADYQKAGELAAQAKSAAETTGDTQLLAFAAEQEASVYYDVGAYDKMRTALDALRETAGPDHVNLRLMEGLLHLDEERGAMAHAQFERGLALSPAEKTVVRRSLLLNMARADIERGRADHGLAHVDAARALASDDASRAAIAAYDARLANAQGRSEDALAAARRGLEGRPALDWRWELELEAGHASKQVDDIRAAESHYRNAIDALEEIRAGQDRSDFKQALLARKRAPFDALVELYVATERPRQALEVAEKARGRALVESIAQFEAERATVQAAQEVANQDLEISMSALGRAVAVAYYRAGDRYYRFLIDEGDVTAARLATTANEIDRLAQSLRSNPDGDDVAQRLGDALSPPSAAQLYLVVAGILADAPLTAIRVDGDYLVERSDIAISPSLGLLGSLAARSTTTPPRAQRWAVLGDPRSDLPSAREEALSIAKRLDTKPHVGQDATADLLARPLALLHVAAHADDDGLHLADKVVSPADVAAQSGAADVVVLATCRGAQRTDGGLFGSLAGAFLVAGSRAVVASSHSLDDDSARDLVLAMYAVGDDASGVARAPAATLSRAQRDFIKQGIPASRWSSIATIGLAHPQLKDNRQ